jgi:hypothetical protein
MIEHFAEFAEDPGTRAELELHSLERPLRKLAIYPASAGFDLVEELDHLCARSIEPNVFFNPRFLAPAMPRLEDREVRLAVIRDGDEAKSRLRLLVPFSVETPALPFGVPVMRSWSSPFGPLGTPLVDNDDPAGVIEDFFAILARPHLKLPKVLVLPEMRLDGPFAAMLRSLADARNLPLATMGEAARPFLQSEMDGDTYLKQALSKRGFGQFQRLRRRLGERGAVAHTIARQPDEVRQAMETFLTLEAAGWKGRARTAMASDRYRAAFAREAVHRLAERDLCRIHMLTLDGTVIASLVVFVESGIGYTWKTAYDEAWSAYSPGTLLITEVTRSHLEDPNIVATDSCSAPDHPVMSRIWKERRPIGTMVVGLTPGADRLARQAAAQLRFYRDSRNMAKALREHVRGLVRNTRKRRER